MNKIVIFLLFIGISCYGRPLRVAVIDTGLNLKDPRFERLICKDANHWNFTNNSRNTKDRIGHGTHVAGLIKKYAGDANYCFMIYNYFSPEDTANTNIDNLVKAFKQAIRDKADIINYSGGGTDFSKEEMQVLKIAEQRKILIVVAAGNNYLNLNTSNFYPASYSYSNLVVVGNLSKNINGSCYKNETSSYGNKVVWELGTDIESTLPNRKTGLLSGTSQATAIRTGKIISGKNPEKCSILNL